MTGRLKFVKRGGAVAATLSETDLSAHEWGGEPPQPIAKTRSQDLELPNEVNVLYFNIGADYQQGTQKAARQSGHSVNSLTLSLPVVMNDTKAKQVADVNLFNAWVQRTTYVLQVSHKWAKLEPTDIIDVLYDSRTFRMRITSKEETKPGVITLECVAEDTAVYSQTGTGAGTSNYQTQVVTIPVQTMILLLDIPALRDADSDAGFYVAANGYRDGWTGCTLFKSDDEGATYTTAFSMTVGAIVGSASEALSNFYGGNVFDESNYLTVTVVSGELSSATELAVLNGANAALIGNEIVQFKNATLIGTKTYRLTGFLRGRRGTESAMGTHAAGERFILISSNAWRRISLPSSDIGIVKMFKAVTFNMTLQQTVPATIIPTGEALDCYSPVLPGCGRTSTNDLVISWTRRSRVDGAWRDYSDVDLGETTESYEVEILHFRTGAILRTLTSSTPSVTYTSAQQITDLGCNPSSVPVKIYQLSSTTGRGDVLAATVSAGFLKRFATRWRLVISDLVGPEAYWHPEVFELQMFSSIGGTNECTGGRPSASHNTDTAYLAFDGTTNSWGGAQYVLPQWLEYTFEEPKAIIQFKLQAGGEPNYWPKDFEFQYYDGSQWVTVAKDAEVSWTAGETKTYNT